MSDSSGEVRVAEWRDLPTDNRSGLEVLVSTYRRLPTIWRWFLIPAALLAPGLAMKVAHSTQDSVILVSLSLLATGRSLSVLSARRNLHAEIWRDAYSVRIELFRYKVKYGEDVGALRFVDDFLIFEGQRTTFSFDCSALREWADVYSKLPSSVPMPFLLLETPSKPIGISFESIEPEHRQRESSTDKILKELRQLRTRRSKEGVINVLPPLEPAELRKRVPLFLALSLIVAAYVLLRLVFDDLQDDLLWAVIGPIAFLSSFVPWQTHLFEKRKREKVFAQLRQEAAELRQRQSSNTVARRTLPETIVSATQGN